MTDRLDDALGAIVGAEHVTASGAAAVDGIAPRFTARPADAGEVSRLLALAHARGLAVVPRGAGTTLGLGNPPRQVDLALDLTRLNRVIEYEPADVTVSVEAGITLDELDRVLGKQRQFLPLDPPGWRARTVGGVLATNASGPFRVRYGSGRDLLLGVRFVQADGTVTWGGAKVVKSVTGYDVPKLLTGSLGTLGVIVEATLRLHPAPEHERTWLHAFFSLDSAGEYLAAIFDSPLQPARVEVLNGAALAAVGQAPARAGVAVSIASVHEAVRAQGQALAELALGRGGDGRPVAESFWDGYGTAIARTRASGVRLRIACLPARVTATIAALETLCGEHGLNARIAGSAGAGALTAAIEGECAAGAWEARVVTPFRHHLADQGGSVIVEQCPRALKERIDVWGPVDQPALDLMKRIKGEFDPRGVLNPGRFVARL